MYLYIKEKKKFGVWNKQKRKTLTKTNKIKKMESFFNW